MIEKLGGIIGGIGKVATAPLRSASRFEGRPKFSENRGLGQKHEREFKFGGKLFGKINARKLSSSIENNGVSKTMKDLAGGKFRRPYTPTESDAALMQQQMGDMEEYIRRLQVEEEELKRRKLSKLEMLAAIIGGSLQAPDAMRKQLEANKA